MAVDHNGRTFDADRKQLCLREAMRSDGMVDPTKLHDVVEREIAAGPMERDGFAQLAEDGIVVLGAEPKREKIGLFKRLFG